jgi:biotin synthase
MEAANRVRRTQFGNKVHLCSIVNAKQGGCPEDCGFCSQSRHVETHFDPQKFLPADEVVEASELAQSRGGSALGLVTATRGLEAGTTAFEKVVDGIRAVRAAGHTEAHGSFGFVDENTLTQLAEAGLTELNHNLETGRSYFGEVVTTHTYDDRIATIQRAKQLGLRTCVGGIVGMGEEPFHRAELALELRALDVDEVPLNFLVSIDGTNLEEVEPLEPLEMLRVIACFRLALPTKNIFIAAGRMHLRHLQPMMFTAGASGMMIGDLLTTPNRTVQDDLDMIFELGLEPESCGGAELPTGARKVSTPARARGHLPVLQA